jgi:hypothetical protein
MTSIRVTIAFIGRQAGALGVGSRYTARRTIEVPDEFTMEEAKEAARVALYYPGADGIAYESVYVKGLSFN